MKTSHIAHIAFLSLLVVAGCKSAAPPVEMSGPKPTPTPQPPPWTFVTTPGATVIDLDKDPPTSIRIQGGEELDFTSTAALKQGPRDETYLVWLVSDPCEGTGVHEFKNGVAICQVLPAVKGNVKTPVLAVGNYCFGTAPTPAARPNSCLTCQAIKDPTKPGVGPLGNANCPVIANSLFEAKIKARAKVKK